MELRGELGEELVGTYRSPEEHLHGYMRGAPVSNSFSFSLVLYIYLDRLKDED